MPRHVDDEQRRTCLCGASRATGAFVIGALVVGLTLGGCAKGADAPAKAATPAPTKTAAPAPVKKATPKPKPAVKKKPAQAKKKTGKRGKPPIKWTDTVDWKPWDEARSISAETGKPLCLVVYADWCPRCKELAPAFLDDDVKALTAQYGGYVPRIFFFDASGQVREDVTSGHTRYPYFYTPRNLAALKASMRKAVGG